MQRFIMTQEILDQNELLSQIREKIQQMSQFLFKNLNSDLINFRKDIRYRTQVGLCVAEGFRKRGFVRADRSDQGWDIYWVEKEAIDNFYVNHRITKDQRLNHYRSYFQICRKDNLNRNLKKYKRNLQRQGRNKQAADYNFAPLTFHLPLQFSSFCEQFKKLSSTNKSNIWIMKPTAKSQGKGIFLFNKLSSIQEWMQNPEAQAYICQRYIQNPLVIGHKKFDLRLYVLCTSYRPLTVHIYRQGFARFTHFRYDGSNIEATEVHLTNVAIQKHTAQYSKHLGGKWMLSQLKKYLITKYGLETTNGCFNEIKNLAIKTLRSVSKIMSNEQNCFQLYGFDIMLDDTLKPWLIQVNGSPSMRANTKKDRQLKVGVIDDMLSVLDIEKILTGNQQNLGGFDLICKKDMNYELQYYSGLKMCMLGCKLERQKCYRQLANTLNTHYKNLKTNNLGNNNTSLSNNNNNNNSNYNNISNYKKYQSEQKKALQMQLLITSPIKKGFSVRKQKQNSNIIRQQLKRQSQSTQKSQQTKSFMTENFKTLRKQNYLGPEEPLSYTMLGQSVLEKKTFRRNSNLVKKSLQQSEKISSLMYSSQDLRQKAIILK